MAWVQCICLGENPQHNWWLVAAPDTGHAMRALSYLRRDPRSPAGLRGASQAMVLVDGAAAPVFLHSWPSPWRATAAEDFVLLASWARRGGGGGPLLVLRVAGAAVSPVPPADAGLSARARRALLDRGLAAAAPPGRPV